MVAIKFWNTYDTEVEEGKMPSKAEIRQFAEVVKQQLAMQGKFPKILSRLRVRGKLIATNVDLTKIGESTPTPPPTMEDTRDSIEEMTSNKDIALQRLAALYRPYIGKKVQVITNTTGEMSSTLRKVCYNIHFYNSSYY